LSSHSDDEESDELPDPWYARIVYLFEDEHSTPMAHFCWFFYTNIGAKPSLGRFLSIYTWERNQAWEVFVHVYIGAKLKPGRVLFYTYMGAGSNTVLKELAGPHERFLLRPRLQKQSDYQTTYAITRINYSKLRNYSLSPDF
jgi:hypothetical protein